MYHTFNIFVINLKIINKLPVDISAALWLARQSIYGIQFKEENHVKYIKKHNEDVSIPYIKLPKQSKKQVDVSYKWKDISLALGKNRNFWYKNLMNFIPTVVQSLSVQNPFEQNQS